MMEKDIRMKAGVIWRLLSDKGILSVRELAELTNYTKVLLFLALGWLSREDKIRFQDRDGTLYIGLTSSTPEIFY